MANDDDARTSGFAGPSQPPRPPVSGPALGAEQVAGPTSEPEIYDDDALAAAFAEESVRLGYSGPVSIIRPDERPDTPPAPSQAAPSQPAPQAAHPQPAQEQPAPLPQRPPQRPPLQPTKHSAAAPPPAPIVGAPIPRTDIPEPSNRGIPLSELPAPSGPPVDVPPAVATVAEEPSVPGRDDRAVELPPPPHRESLADADLLNSLDDQPGAPGSPLTAMQKLEQQMRLRADEAVAYREWEDRMLSIGTPAALKSVEEIRPEFADVLIPAEDLLQFLESAKSSEEAATAVTNELVQPAPIVPAPIEPTPAAPPTWSSIVPSAADYPPPEPVEPLPVIDPALGLLKTGSHEVTGSPFDVEPEDDVDETDRVPTGATWPFAVTADGVAIPQPGTATAPIPPLEAPRPTSGEVVIPDDRRRGPQAFAFETAGLEPTAVDQRVAHSVRLFWLWFSANSSVLSLAFGGVLFSLGVSLRQAIVAAFIGVAISFLPLGLGTLAGKWSGQPTMVVSRATFGHLGNILPAAIAVLTRLFWGAVLLWLIGASAARILVGARLAGSFSERQVTLLAMAIGFLIALVVAYFGYGLFARIQLALSIIAAVLIAGLVVLTWPSVDFAKALTVGDGPWILVVTGVVLVFSFVGLIWANSSADLARYQRPGTSGAASMLLAPLGTTLAPFLLIAYGAVLAASNPATATGLTRTPIDTIAALLPSWYPIPLLAATTLSLISGVILSIYSGGFALQATGLRLQRSWSTVIVGALLFAVAVLFFFTVTDAAPLFRDVATTLAVPVAAWAGIFAAEMLTRRRRFDTDSLLVRGGVYPAVNWVNLSMLIVATAIGLGFTSATVGWLGWEGYLFGAAGIPLSSDLGGTDIGVLVALVLGVLTPLVAGVPTVRRQEQTRA